VNGRGNVICLEAVRCVNTVIWLVVCVGWEGYCEVERFCVYDGQ